MNYSPRKESSHLTSLRSWPSSLKTIGTHLNQYLHGHCMLVRKWSFYTMSCWLPVCVSLMTTFLNLLLLIAFALRGSQNRREKLCDLLLWLCHSIWFITVFTLMSVSIAWKQILAPVALVFRTMPSTVVWGSKRAISRFSPLLSLWAVVLKILVCPYEEVSSSLETIGTHLHQYLDIVHTCSTGQEILVEFHPMCSCTLWEQWIHSNLTQPSPFCLWRESEVCLCYWWFTYTKMEWLENLASQWAI